MIEVCLILCASLAAVGIACYAHARLTGNSQPARQESAEPTAVENPDECCGLHAVCEKTTAAALAPEIIYYDDDELDVYAGRPAHAYNDAEIEQFRDIMLTLQSADVPGWQLSLSRRNIALPAPLQPEFELLLSDI